MAPVLFKASAPGSLMLLGEYAVLNGNPALVTAIDKRITVTLVPREDHYIEIHSSLATHSTTTERLASHDQLRFVMTALQHIKSFPSGFNLSIESEFSSTMGLGSSAAVTVATLQALNQWLEQTLTPEALWQQCMGVIHAVQGKGSGADVAASILGGVVLFYNHPLNMRVIQNTLPLCVVFSGNKISTAEALKKMPALPDWEKTMSSLTEQALLPLQNQDWSTLGALLNEGQTLMVQRGVSNTPLDEITQMLRQQPHIFGAKISGAGFGDCVIGLGELDDTTDLQPLPLTAGSQGVHTY